MSSRKYWVLVFTFVFTFGMFMTTNAYSFSLKGFENGKNGHGECDVNHGGIHPKWALAEGCVDDPPPPAPSVCDEVNEATDGIFKLICNADGSIDSAEVELDIEAGWGLVYNDIFPVHGDEIYAKINITYSDVSAFYWDISKGIYVIDGSGTYAIDTEASYRLSSSLLDLTAQRFSYAETGDFRFQFINFQRKYFSNYADYSTYGLQLYRLPSTAAPGELIEQLDARFTFRDVRILNKVVVADLKYWVKSDTPSD